MKNIMEGWESSWKNSIDILTIYKQKRNKKHTTRIKMKSNIISKSYQPLVFWKPCAPTPTPHLYVSTPTGPAHRLIAYLQILFLFYLLFLYRNFFCHFFFSHHSLLHSFLLHFLILSFHIHPFSIILLAFPFLSFPFSSFLFLPTPPLSLFVSL